MRNIFRTAGVSLIILIQVFAISGCAKKDSDITIVWTDQAEFALYAELFNNSQSRYRVVVEYKENPANALITAKKRPDVVIGPWLKGEKTRSKLIPVDYLFNEFRINPKLFYQPLLDLGNIRGHQYLLPVSFNLPALIFAPDKKLEITNDFSISLDQVQKLSHDFNVQQKSQYTKMGFSPRWNNEFLYITAQLFNAKFEEKKPLFGWNQTGMNEAITYLRDWSTSINTSTTAEDEFAFKYLYDPPYKLVTDGRNLFSFISSSDLFVLPHDKIQNIDFRWISRNNEIPINDNIIYAGICKNAAHLEAAEAFLSWFFNDKNQKVILENCRKMGTMNRTFGISGGFSSLTTVNEKTFPLYYPSLLGHLPPAETLAVPRILPNNWELLKKDILIPYLADAVQKQNAPGQETLTLENRITNWIKSH
jgi:ABC-type glycerol-3-phosphate transport system substrate-binding protein